MIDDRCGLNHHPASQREVADARSWLLHELTPTSHARERMSSLALNIVPDDRVSIVAGPFSGNPITSMSVCWSMPGKGGEEGDAQSNTLSDIDGAVVVGHANGACNIYSNNASVDADKQEVVRPNAEESGEILPAIKWKKQRAQPQRAWLRRKITTILDEAIVGVECDCFHCYLVVGIKRLLKIDVRDRKSIVQYHFRFGNKVIGATRRHSTFAHIHDKKVLCAQSKSPSYFLDCEENTESIVSMAQLDIERDAYVSDFDGTRALIVEKDDDAMEFRIMVKRIFDEEQVSSNSENMTGEEGKEGDDAEVSRQDEEDSTSSMDSADVSSFYYSIKREPWGFQFVSSSGFLSIESDRTVIVHDCNTLEHIYKPLKIKSRIISFTPVKCADPNKHAVLFLCRDDNLKLYLNGEIVASKLLPSSTIHSFAMGLPYLCSCDASVHGKFFYNDDNYLYHYNIPDDMLQLMA